MNKINQLLLLVIICFGTMISYGQSTNNLIDGMPAPVNPNAFNLTISDAIISNLIYSISDFSRIRQIIEDNNLDESSSNVRNSPFLSIQFEHQLSRRYYIGVDVSYYQYSSNRHFQQQGTTNTFVTATSRMQLSYAPTFKWVYVDRPKFQFYGRLTLGATLNRETFSVKENDVILRKESSTKPGAIFQISPISLRFGGKFAGIFEMGIGTKGIFTGGISYRF